MKYKWKLFLTMMAIIMISYSISGSILITSAFRSAYQREVEFAREEHEILQNTFMTILASLGNSQVDNALWTQVARELQRNNGRQNLTYWLGTEEMVVYTSPSIRTQNIAISYMAGAQKPFALHEVEGKHFITISSKMTAQDSEVIIVSVREITNAYQNRTEQIAIFRRVMCMIMLITGLTGYLTANHLTKPLYRLSRITRKIADGDFRVRTTMSGSDELGELAKDINNMADSLEVNIAELNNAVRRQEDFVAAFAHELKTPLTSIIGYADMLRSRELEPELTFSAANYIFSEGKRLEGLSFKLLELMVTKKQGITLKKLNAVYFLKEVKGSLLPLLTKEHIALTVKQEKGYLMAEGDLLKSVIFNLVDNARKAMGKEEIDEKGKKKSLITITGQAKEESYEILIEDNGRGIPAYELDKITEAFYMVDKSRAREQGGAGLGLSLCKQIMELHEGTMKIESELNVGTKITLVLQGGGIK